MTELLLGALVGGLVVGPLLSAMIQHWLEKRRNHAYEVRTAAIQDSINRKTRVMIEKRRLAREADEIERIETARDRARGIGVKEVTQWHK